MLFLKAQMQELVFSQINTGKQCWNRVLHYMGQLKIYIKVDINTLGLAHLSNF